MNQREKLIVLIALSYAKSNLDDLNETLYFDEDKIKFLGDLYHPLTEKELEQLITKQLKEE